MWKISLAPPYRRRRRRPRAQSTGCYRSLAAATAAAYAYARLSPHIILWILIRFSVIALFACWSRLDDSVRFGVGSPCVRVPGRAFRSPVAHFWSLLPQSDGPSRQRRRRHASLFIGSGTDPIFLFFFPVSGVSRSLRAGSSSPGESRVESSRVSFGTTSGRQVGETSYGYP